MVYMKYKKKVTWDSTSSRIFMCTVHELLRRAAATLVIRLRNQRINSVE